MAEMVYYLGILMALVATSLFNLCPILQKDALNRMQEISFQNLWQSVKMMFGDKKWVLGTFFGIIGGLPYTIALNWTGISVIQPLMPFGFIILVIGAKRTLKEKLDLKAQLAIGLMILMPIFVSLGNLSNSTLDITELSAQIRIACVAGLLSFIIAILWILAKKYSILWTIIAGIGFALGAILSQATMSLITFGGYDLLQDFGLILKNLFIDPNLLKMFFLLIITLVANLIASFALQIALQKVPASQCTPVQQTINTIITAVGGIVVYGQLVGNWVFYSIGMGFAIIGTIILGRYQISESKPEILEEIEHNNKIDIQKNE